MHLGLGCLLFWVLTSGLFFVGFVFHLEVWAEISESYKCLGALKYHIWDAFVFFQVGHCDSQLESVSRYWELTFLSGDGQQCSGLSCFTSGINLGLQCLWNRAREQRWACHLLKGSDETDKVKLKYGKKSKYLFLIPCLLWLVGSRERIWCLFLFPALCFLSHFFFFEIWVNGSSHLYLIVVWYLKLIFH